MPVATAPTDGRRRFARSCCPARRDLGCCTPRRARRTASEPRAATALASPLRRQCVPAIRGRAPARRWLWPRSPPSLSSPPIPAHPEHSPPGLPDGHPEPHTESPVVSWQPSLPFVWSFASPNLQEGACFQYALGGARGKTLRILTDEESRAFSAESTL